MSDDNQDRPEGEQPQTRPGGQAGGQRPAQTFQGLASLRQAMTQARPAATGPAAVPSTMAQVPEDVQPKRDALGRSYATGKRKNAVARVWIKPGTGKIEVNGRELNDYFTNERDRKAIFGPLEVTNTGGKMDIFVNATGGGPTGQAGAIVMGLGRALAKYDQSLEAPLRGSRFLTRDSRMKERKKYGQRGARRRFQFSKR
jgi:small subunit ribosomal protein S9